MILKNESLDNWIENNFLVAKEINERTIEIPEVGKFLLVEPKNIKVVIAGEEEIRESVVFDTEFQMQLNPIEDKYCDTVDYLLFEFGNNWYYTDSLTPEEIKEFKYLGKANITFTDINYPHLAIHGGYELCNGSRQYKDWCKKAKFLNIQTLGICEENTLAGTLDFQDACSKADIRSIIGETITILTTDRAKFNIKLYVQDQEGWKNLLWINKLINVDNEGAYIKEEELFNRNINTEGLICVLNPDVDLKKYYGQDKFEFYFSDVYYQIDFVEWSSQTRDEHWLLAIKDYFDNYQQYGLKPLLICDSYYLDKADHIIKQSLNTIGKIGFKSQSADQYFKSIDEIFIQVSELYAENDASWFDKMKDAVSNTNELCASIDFKIPVGQFRLPAYEMTEEEKIKYSTLEEMMWGLIEEGLEKKVFNKGLDEEVYLDRIQTEFEVIKGGGVISYFLILADIIRWCKEQNILVGIGRGSSAGSLIAYCLDITKIDPLPYELLFERFLNAGRVGKSLPDIDTDFPGERRDEVKAYIENKYGTDYVASIGTYSTLKIKSALKDLCREKGVDYNKTNFAASLIDGAVISDKMAGITFTELFKHAASKSELKEFIQKNYSIIEKFNLCLNQPKTSSVHASGVLIVPKDLGTIYQQMPVKSIGGQLISEWEGEFIDKAGFLKCDILGVKQLDKIAAIFKLIKETTGDVITFDDMRLDDDEVMQLFKDGNTEDVFQFGTAGLKAYCKEMKPDDINDLIAAVALYRPGAMGTGAHKKYIRVKNKQEQISYDEGTESITKNTYGILIYQEQIMQVCAIMAGFDLVESDDIRKALGKKDKELLDSYKDKFVVGCVKNGFIKSKTMDLWDKMESFAEYSFNKSHAAAYAITGYYCQWLKQKYPIQFWTVAMQFSKDDEIINRISEINKVSDIEVATVDINKSRTSYYAEDNVIYWRLAVKWVGVKAVEEITTERAYGGEFFSVEDFCDRMKSRSINKRCIINLILAGAFDKIEKINPSQRHLLLIKYHNFTNNKMSDELTESKKWKDYQWVLRQKELTGFGVIDYKKIVKSSPTFSPHHKKFRENIEVLMSDADDISAEPVVSGIVQNLIERKSKKGVFGQLEIVDNTDTLYITLWNESYEPLKKELATSKNSIVILNGAVKFDSYKQSNVLHSTKRTVIEIV